MTNFVRGADKMAAAKRARCACSDSNARFQLKTAALCSVALLASALCMAPAARAQGSRKDDIVFNAQGRPMAGATVRVCTASATGQPCTPLANIYSDTALTQALANPLATDGLGNYTFYAAPGRYTIEIDGPGITPKQLPNVILPNDPSAPTFASLTTTSGINAFSLSLSGNLTVTGSTAVTGALTVGGAPVPSTAQANTWSAAQTFDQDLILGSRTPWLDVRANGAACNGSTDDATAINGVINGLPATGGNAFIPDNCVFTPPSSYTNPSSFTQTITLGGRATVKGTLTVPGISRLDCATPVLHATWFSFNLDRNVCPIIPSPTSISPIVTFANPSGNGNSIANIGLNNFTGVGIDAGGSNIIFDNVFSQPNSDTGTPLLLRGGFGYYFKGGGFSSNSGAGQPSILFQSFGTDPDSCGNGAHRISQLDHTYWTNRGVHFASTCSDGTMPGTFVGSFKFIQNLYEDGTECMICVDITNSSYLGFEIDNPQVADPIPGDSVPIIGVSGPDNSGNFISSLITEPTGTVFSIPPGDHQSFASGAVIIGCATNTCNSGLYGAKADYFNISRDGGLTTYAGGTTGASIAAGSGLVVPVGAPYAQPVSSTTGGTLAAGTWYYMAVGIDSLGHEGEPGANMVVTTTGTTSSVTDTLYTMYSQSNSAVSYHVYRSSHQIEDQASDLVYFTVSPGAFASGWVDTGTAGTAGSPTQLMPQPGAVGGTAFLNPIGDSYLGMSGNTGVGTQSPSSKLDVAGNAALTIGGFHGIFTHADTANRTYTFPDASGTVCLTSTCGSGGGNVSSSGTPTAGQVAQWVTSTTIKGSTALAYRTCTMVIAGTGAGGVLQSSDISATLDGQDCELVGAGTLVEVDVRVDGGTSSVLLGRDRAGTVANIVSAALAGGGAGTATCSNTSATTGAISGLTCAGTLQNTSLNAGDWLGVVSGTPDGTTKRVSISIVYQLS